MQHELELKQQEVLKLTDLIDDISNELDLSHADLKVKETELSETRNYITALLSELSVLRLTDESTDISDVDVDSTNDEKVKI